MTLDLAAIAPIVLTNIALLLALTVLLRQVRDAARPVEASQQFLAGLVLGGIAICGIYLAGDAQGVTLGAAWPAVLLAAPLGGPLAAVVAFLLSAGLHFWLDGMARLAETGPFGPEIAILGFLALIGIIGDQWLRRQPVYPTMRVMIPLVLVGAIGYLAISLGMAAMAGAPFDPDGLGPLALEAALNVIPGALLVMAIHLAEKARREAEDGLEFASISVDEAADGILWLGGSGKVHYCNDAACKLLGYTKDELTRRYLRDLDHNAGDPRGPNQRLTASNVTFPQLFNGRFIAKTGNAITLAIAANKVVYEDQPTILVSLRVGAVPEVEGDVAPDHEAELPPEGETEAPKRKAPKRRKRDSLTGLPDFVEFQEMAISLAPKAEKREIDNLTIAVIDMDDMTGFNDRRGYQMGDALLATYARVLRQSLRTNDQAFRIDDDAFGVIMPGRGEGAFDYLLGRFEDIMASVQNAGFPEADATVGFAALSETEFDADRAYEVALERLRRSKGGYQRVLRGRKDAGA